MTTPRLYALKYLDPRVQSGFDVGQVAPHLVQRGLGPGVLGESHGEEGGDKAGSVGEAASASAGQGGRGGGRHYVRHQAAVERRSVAVAHLLGQHQAGQRLALVDGPTRLHESLLHVRVIKLGVNKPAKNQIVIPWMIKCPPMYVRYFLP